MAKIIRPSSAKKSAVRSPAKASAKRATAETGLTSKTGSKPGRAATKTPKATSGKSAKPKSIKSKTIKPKAIKPKVIKPWTAA